MMVVVLAMGLDVGAVLGGDVVVAAVDLPLRRLRLAGDHRRVVLVVVGWEATCNNAHKSKDLGVACTFNINHVVLH